MTERLTAGYQTNYMLAVSRLDHSAVSRQASGGFHLPSSIELWDAYKLTPYGINLSWVQ